ncbi:MAG TPA: hypothetical protein VN408_18160 [Actinoplanes sp.]|nr:hypothetical protein [Actinoplanes sp.]
MAEAEGPPRVGEVGVSSLVDVNGDSEGTALHMSGRDGEAPGRDGCGSVREVAVSGWDGVGRGASLDGRWSVKGRSSSERVDRGERPLITSSATGSVGAGWVAGPPGGADGRVRRGSAWGAERA